MKNHRAETKAAVVLITGASSGLGNALAHHLHDRGYRVYGTSRRAGRHRDPPFQMISLDVNAPDSIREGVRRIIEKEGRIDALINNAGIGIAGPMEQLSMKHVEDVFNTNVFGVIRLCQAVLPHMRSAGSGKIINISSIGSVVGLPFRGVYCASKAAVDMIAESLRMEVQSFGIEVCALRAGDIRTAINEHRIMDYDPSDPAYRESFEKVARGINEDVNHGMSPEAVALEIERILRNRRFKRTYAVGKWLQKLSITAKKILPGRWFERIIMNYSNL